MPYVPASVLFNGIFVDYNDTPGYPPGTKGVGFGELLTSANTNRITYALALNLDDHEARLLATSTLDGAYRAGVANDPELGRVINVNGGAVELSGSAAGDKAFALLRIDGTTITSRVCADLLVRDVGPEINNTSYGHLERAWFIGTGGTNVALGAAGVLNPGGTGPTRVEVSVGSFATAGNGCIIPNYDLLEVTNAGAKSGLYRITGVVSDTVVTVATLNQANPAFAADTACNVTLYRPRVATRPVGSSLSLAESVHTTIAPPLLQLYTHDHKALAVSWHDGTTVSEVMSVSKAGSLHFTAPVSPAPPSDDAYGTLAARVNYPYEHGYAGFVASGVSYESDGAQRHFLSVTRQRVDVGNTMAMVCNSESGGLRISSGPHHIPKATLIEVVSNTADPAYNRVYRVRNIHDFGSTITMLEDLDGTPVTLPNLESFNLYMLHGGFLGSSHHTWAGGGDPTFTPAPVFGEAELHASAELTAPGRAGGSGLVLFGSTFPSEQFFIRGVARGGISGSGTTLEERFSVSTRGDMYLDRDIYAGRDVIATGDFKYGTPVTRSHTLGFESASLHKLGGTWAAASYLTVGTNGEVNCGFTVGDLNKTGKIRRPIDPPVGTVLVRAGSSVYFSDINNGSGGGLHTLVARIERAPKAGGAPTTVMSASGSHDSGAYTLSFSAGDVTHTVLADYRYTLVVEITGPGAGTSSTASLLSACLQYIDVGPARW